MKLPKQSEAIIHRSSQFVYAQYRWLFPTGDGGSTPPKTKTCKVDTGGCNFTWTCNEGQSCCIKDIDYINCTATKSCADGFC
jgi:hypothetical protein